MRLLGAYGRTIRLVVVLASVALAADRCAGEQVEEDCLNDGYPSFFCSNLGDCVGDSRTNDLTGCWESEQEYYCNTLVRPDTCPVPEDPPDWCQSPL